MVNYNNGKIYKIIDNTNGNIYIGSTTKQYLSQRLTKHVSDYKQFLNGKTNFVTSFKIIENNNYTIELIELYPCGSKDELQAHEGYHIRNNECVNRCIAGRTYKKYYEDNKDIICEKVKAYREANRDKIKESKKEYYEDNRDKIKEQRKSYREANKEQAKAYREANRDKIKEQDKAYREANRDKIREKNKAYREKQKNKNLDITVL